jgi:hypothetical protein
MTMVRKQVYISKAQDEDLKRLSALLGVSEAELIREGIEFVKARRQEEAADRAWHDLVCFMKERGKLEIPQQPRTWTRDHLYDD